MLKTSYPSIRSLHNNRADCTEALTCAKINNLQLYGKGVNKLIQKASVHRSDSKLSDVGQGFEKTGLECPIFRHILIELCRLMP